MEFITQFLQYIYDMRPSDGVLLTIFALIFATFGGHGKANYYKYKYWDQVRKNKGYKKQKPSSRRR